MLVSRNSLIRAFLTPKSTPKSVTSHAASFHSTPVSCQKWKSKWKADVKATQQPPSKDHIRFTTRQKNSDSKKALNNLLFNGGFSKTSSKAEEPIIINRFKGRDVDGTQQKRQPKAFTNHAGKSYHKKIKRRNKRRNFSDEDTYPDPETVFRATFGEKQYTWSFANNFFSGDAASGFEGSAESDRSSRRKRGWASSSESEPDEEDFTCTLGGTHSDRKILGLPPTGPLTMEDVKNAFRLSALKWHPDKHQGSSQEMAEEKFKLCVDAYKSLCAAIS